MQGKDSDSHRNKPPFKIEHFTILLAEYEYLENENKELFCKYESNLVRQRNILREIGAVQEVKTSANYLDRMELGYNFIMREETVISELILFLQNSFNLVHKKLYEEKLETAHLKNEIKTLSRNKQ